MFDPTKLSPKDLRIRVHDVSPLYETRSRFPGKKVFPVNSERKITISFIFHKIHDSFLFGNNCIYRHDDFSSDGYSLSRTERSVIHKYRTV